MGWRTRIYRLGRRCYPVRKLAVCIGSTSKALLLMASMGCCCAKPARLDVTSWGPNFAELFFCQLRCNARCDRPHKYPLLVNICALSGSPRRALRHLAPGYPQLGCFCSFLDGSNAITSSVATCSCPSWGAQSYLYANRLGFFVG